MDPNKFYYPDLVLQQLVDRLLKPEVGRNMSISNIKNIRNLGATCRHFYQYLRKHYYQYYDLILFFKGKFSQSRHNSRFFRGLELREIATTNKFWVIPRPIGNASYYSLGSYIRFSHFCLDRDYDYLKKEILQKEFGYNGHPAVTDLIGPLAETDPQFEMIKSRLNRIRKGKVKKVSLLPKTIQVISDYTTSPDYAKSYDDFY